MYILHKDGNLELVERAFKVRSFLLFSKLKIFQMILWCFLKSKKWSFFQFQKIDQIN